MALAWTLVFPGPLLAKPTGTIPRPSAARLVAAQPAQHAPHERATRRAVAARRGTHSAPHKGAQATSRAGDAPKPTRRSESTARPVAASGHAGKRAGLHRKSLEAARDIPASPSTARRVHPRERTRREAAHSAIVAADLGPSAPHSLGDGTATGDESLAEHTGTAASASLSGDARGLAPLKSIEEEASTPVLLPSLRVSSLYDRRGRLMVPAPLYGSREILLRQNQMADRDGLDRVRDDAGLLDLLREKKLVALPANEMLLVDQRLPENRRYSRPWTAAFLAVLSRDYYASFHQPLQITSAVRTVAFQQRLGRTNGNAAPAGGDTASPHLTGQAIDIAKHGLSITQIAWMRAYLQPLIGQNKIDVEEEFRQACFHISVYKSFVPAVSHVTVAARQLPVESHP
jgi:hypothetical protein